MNGELKGVDQGNMLAPSFSSHYTHLAQLNFTTSDQGIFGPQPYTCNTSIYNTVLNACLDTVSQAGIP